ncbi:YjbF family lipoprotein [Dickeya poaceiphila]|uniref:YjbF family lipoprotein n=1 Tax=Dickeya poaceiphila TaxID=568768 RepID=A0A5B8HMI7_9GAMM|nr:YjbF family lipoprotein [Dickeya poaceiphila]QDX30575.1 YjbF family lipoprotein [Dickeya poaceiphila]
MKKIIGLDLFCVLLVIPLILLGLTGCSQQFSQWSQTFLSALSGPKDTSMTSQQVEQIPYASAYLKVGEAPRVFVVLAFVDNQQLKWLTADKNRVVTRFGRLVETQGFGEDIQHVGNLDSDPLSLGLLKPDTPKQWHTIVSWSQVLRGGYDVQSVFENKGPEILTILNEPRQTVRFDEQVTVPTLNKHYTNQYWLDPDSGQVVQSHQYMGPNMALVQFTVLRPYIQ